MYEIVKEIFKVSLISYLLFYLINTLWPGFVSNYFNLNILVITALVSGIFVMGASHEESGNQDGGKISSKGYFGIILVGIASAGIIYYQLNSVGKFAYAVSIFSGLLVIFLLLLINVDANDHNQEKNE